MKPNLDFGRPWTSEDDGLFASVYAAGGISAAQAAFPARSRLALFRRAQHLSVKRRPVWTSFDDARLRRLWSSEPLKEIAKALGRSQKAAYNRGIQLGLELGKPTQGFEFLSHACTRTGYQSTQLRRILRWAGVPVYRAPGWCSGHCRGRFQVDPLDVDDAVASYLATETIQSAARRLGIQWRGLHRLLDAAGVLSDPVPGERRERRTGTGRLHRRVRTEVIDRVVREAADRRAQTETVNAAARRHGCCNKTLSRWLAESGLPRLGRVETSVTDRVVAARRARRESHSRPRNRESA